MSSDESKNSQSGGEQEHQSSGGQGRQKSGSDKPTTAEKTVMATSVAFTVLLLTYVVWQAVVTPPAVAPEANAIGTTTMSDGSVQVNVELVNNQDIGLISATVEVNCTSPPPEIEFQHVPADGRLTGYVVCTPGTTNPEVSVSTWVEA